MNWTGGRLQRHSYRNNNPTKNVQRQHFAKVRWKSVNRNRTVSPFKIPTWAVGKNPSDSQTPIPNAFETLPVEDEDNDARNKRPRSIAVRENSRSLQDKVGELLDVGEEQPLSEGNMAQAIESHPGAVEDIKRTLLRQKDWASLSVAQPLKMRFTSEEERYNFGRRRPLTEADRRRRASGEERTPLLPFSHEKMPDKPRSARNAFSQNSASDINIRIGGQKDHSAPQSCRSQSFLLSQESTESMLFDKEENGYEGTQAWPSTEADWGTSSNTNISGLQPCNTGVVKRGQHQETQSGVDSSSTTRVSPLPTLDRHGSFAVQGSRTKYVPPRLRNVCVRPSKYPPSKDAPVPFATWGTLEKTRTPTPGFVYGKRNRQSTRSGMSPVTDSPVNTTQNILQATQAYPWGKDKEILKKQHTTDHQRWYPKAQGYQINASGRLDERDHPLSPHFNDTDLPLVTEYKTNNHPYVFSSTPRECHNYRYGVSGGVGRRSCVISSPKSPNEQITVYGQKIRFSNSWPRENEISEPENDAYTHPNIVTATPPSRKITVYGQTINISEDDWPE